MFLNETEDVTQKAKAREVTRSQKLYAKPKKAAERHAHIAQRQQKSHEQNQCIEVPVTWRSRLIFDEVQSWSAEAFLPTSIAPAVEDHAIAFFLTHYVQANHDHTRGQFEYLPTLCNKAGIDRFFSLAVSAVGLAGLANTVRSPHLLVQAKQRYWQAVQMTNFALSQPELAIRDTTLLSVILLGMFESVTFEDREALKNFDMHIAGTTAIIIMRGTAQFDTHMGIRIFQQFHNHYLFHCVRHRKPVDKDIKRLREYAAGLHAVKSPDWRLMDISSRWVDHIAGLRVMNGPAGGDSNMVASTSAALDDELQTLAKDMTGIWSYDIVHVDPSEGASLSYHGYYHVYHEHWMAQIWNSLRGLRILLNELLSGLLQRVIDGFPRNVQVPIGLRKKLQDCIKVQKELTADICASIPQHLGQIQPRQATKDIFTSSSPASSSSKSPKFSSTSSHPTVFPPTPTSLAPSPRCSPSHPTSAPPIHAVPFKPNSTTIGRGINFLLWPLFVCGNIRTTTREEREWLITRLEFVGGINGNCQAKILAGMLRDENAGKGFKP